MNKLRKYVSILLTYAFLIVAFTGLILFIAPHGRVANWTNWKILGLTKGQYEDIHTVFGFFMIILSIIHIYLNWNALIFYLKNKARIRISKEFIISTLIVIFLFLGIVFLIPPFSIIIDMGEKLSNGWEKEESIPPIPHAEKMTLSELSGYINISVDSIISIFGKKGIEVNGEEIFGDVAKKYDISPDSLYNIIKNAFLLDQHGEDKTKYNMGIGQMTIKDICDRESIDVNKALKNLSKKGLKVSVSNTLKEIADSNNTTPREIYNMMLDDK